MILTTSSVSLASVRLGAVAVAVAIAASLAHAPTTLAQTYPTQTIKLVVPFPAGGGTDTVARLTGQKLGEALKQTIVIENIGGASGALGHDAVARAQPDGYTLLMATASTIVTTPLVSSVRWDPVKSFTPISMMVVDPMPLILNPSVPATNVTELIKLAKEKPSTLTMASFGVGSVPHLAGELFNSLAGIKMVHVPYRGGGQALNDIIGGHVSLMFNSVGAITGAVATGQVRAIAVGAAERSRGLPNVPTIKESGLPQFEATTWIGLFGPAGLPQPIVDRLSREITAMLELPDVRDTMGKMGFDNRSGTPAELVQTLANDLKRWERVVKEGNIKAP